MTCRSRRDTCPSSKRFTHPLLPHPSPRGKDQMLKNQHLEIDARTFKCWFSSTMQNTVKLSAIVIATLTLFVTSCCQQGKQSPPPTGGVIGSK